MIVSLLTVDTKFSVFSDDDIIAKRVSTIIVSYYFF